MAGRFLTLDEAARHLGVTVEEINRLVDRKQLFPMRDGANVKFKLEEIERVAADRGDAGDAVSDLSLDLSSPSLAGSGSVAGGGLEDDVLVLGDDNEESDDDSIFGDLPALPGASGTVVPAGGGTIADGQGSALGSSDLELDSIIAASSSPSLPKGPAAGSDVMLGGSGPLGGSGTLAIDLSNLGSGPAGGSGAGLSAPSLSDPLGTSGISLEGSDLAASGIDLAASGIGGASGIGAVSGIGAAISGIGAAAASGIGGGLGGDAFELGTDLGDDDSASVVMPVEESGDSSFFGTVGEDSSQSMSTGGSIAVPIGEDFIEGAVGPAFNGWQITGLVCTTLLLLLCGFVTLDLVSTIRNPAATPVSSPLLQALTGLFAWK